MNTAHVIFLKKERKRTQSWHVTTCYIYVKITKIPVSRELTLTRSKKLKCRTPVWKFWNYWCLDTTHISRHISYNMTSYKINIHNHTVWLGSSTLTLSPQMKQSTSLIASLTKLDTRLSLSLLQKPSPSPRSNFTPFCLHQDRLLLYFK